MIKLDWGQPMAQGDLLLQQSLFPWVGGGGGGGGGGTIYGADHLNVTVPGYIWCKLFNFS